MKRALAGVAVLLLGTAGPALAGNINGTWSGRFIFPRGVGKVPVSVDRKSVV